MRRARPGGPARQERPRRRERTFIVTNSDPKGPKTIGIVESKDKLDAHVGHKIDITGTGVSTKEVESLEGSRRRPITT